MTPSEYLTENEIAAAATADQGGVFNPQQQFPVRWPAEPVVASVYVGQLTQMQAIPESFAADVTSVLDRSAPQLEAGTRDKRLARSLKSLSKSLKTESGDALANKRKAALSETLDQIAARLK